MKHAVLSKHEPMLVLFIQAGKTLREFLFLKIVSYLSNQPLIWGFSTYKFTGGFFISKVLVSYLVKCMTCEVCHPYWSNKKRRHCILFKNERKAFYDFICKRVFTSTKINQLKNLSMVMNLFCFLDWMNSKSLIKSIDTWSMRYFPNLNTWLSFSY